MFEKSFSENIIANAPLGIVTTDLSGRITFINRFAARIHHQSEPSKLVRHHISFLASPDPEDFMLTFHSVLNKEREKAATVYTFRSEDAECFVRATMTMLRDEQYNSIGVLIMCEDISERQKLREVLLKEKEFSASIVETANLMIVGFRTDGSIILFNRASEELTGYRRNEVLGADWFELFAPEENQEEIVEVFYRTLDGGSPSYCEYPIRTRSGEKRVIAWHQTFLPEEKDRPPGIVAIGEDITEKRSLEEQLINERERLNLILTSIGAGLLVVDRDCNITYQNPMIEEYFGSCVGKNCLEALRGTLVVGGKKGTCRECPVRLVIEKGLSQANAEIKRKDRNGSDLWIQLIATPVRDEFGDMIGALELVIPINERKKLEEQLLQAQKMEAVGMLTGGIAHDFNNVLGAILGYCTLVKSNLIETDRNYRYVEMMLSAAKHAAGLTERLLSFSRRTRRRSVTLDANELVEEVISLIRSSLGGDIRVQTRRERNLPPLIGDKTQLEQLMINIMINARDAMPNGGTITLSTNVRKLTPKFCKEHLGATAGNNIAISISDTGSGMSEETRRHIFEPFFTTKGEGKGTGLGLSIAYSVIRNHKGYLDVESTEGKGTTFTIYIPAGRSRDKAAGKRDEGTPQTRTILVADREETVRSLLQQALSSQGYKVVTASDADEVSGLFKQAVDEIDLAIVDMFLPGGKASELIDEMRKIRPKMKAIVSSSVPSSSMEGGLFLDDCTGYLEKPFKIGQVSQLVAEVMGDGDSDAANAPEDSRKPR